MDPYPASPEPAYNPNDKGPRPASVDTAVKLIWASVALGIISALLSFTQLDAIVEQAQGSGSAALSEDAARGAAITGVIIGLVISVAIYALLATFIGRGANWARIVWTVLAGIGLLFGLFGIGNQPALLLVVTLISYVLTFATLFFLYKSESNAYFASKPVA